jgi:hypothetical protein
MPELIWTDLQTGTFRMFAEYEDASYASGAVTRSRKINGSFKLQNITVSVDLHRPDLIEEYQPHRTSPAATPTRRPGEQSVLSDTLGNMSLNHSIGSSGTTGTSPFGPQSNNSGMHYLPTTPGYPLPDTLPYVMGGLANLYLPSAVNGFQQVYAPDILSPQSTSGPIDHPYSTFMAPSYVQNGFHQHGFGIPGTEFQHSHFGNELNNHFKQSSNHSRDHGQYNRAGGRRTYVPRAPQGRAQQHSNPANSHHNHVDISRIRQGIDVRTTVSQQNVSLFGTQADRFLGHAPQHPKQG